jgi:hypothetical protein
VLACESCDTVARYSRIRRAEKVFRKMNIIYVIDCKIPFRLRFHHSVRCSGFLQCAAALTLPLPQCHKYAAGHLE